MPSADQHYSDKQRPMAAQAAQVQYEQENGPQPGFDLRTLVRDERSGEILKNEPYTLHNEGGIEYFESPKGSGNLFYRNGEPAGRIEFPKVDKQGRRVGKGEIKLGEEHKEFEKPLDANADLFAQNKALSARNAEIERELAALKAEREANKPKPQAAAAQPAQAGDGSKGK